MPADDPPPRRDDTASFDAEATMNVPVPEARVPVYPYFPGEAILPGYRLEKRLGAGGFGEVWRASAPGGMAVAIKILANLGRAQGGREYRALQTIKNIRHAHITPIFGVWLKSGDGHILDEAESLDVEQRLLAPPAPKRPAADAAQIVTAELPSGAMRLESLELLIAMGLGDQTLSERLREHADAGETGIPTATLLPWMRQAALALDHFNSGSRRGGENARAVQHCEIKPQNMLLVGDAVQVCDFGLARAQGEVRATSNTMASLAYAAPEMVSGGRDPAPTTDQYSLAITYLELRTGQLPYAEPSPASVLRAKLEGTLDLARLPVAEAAAVRRALAVDPALRWPSCVAFVRALETAVEAGAETAPAPMAETAALRPGPIAVAAPQPAAGPARGARRRALAAGAAVAGLAVLLGAATLLGRRSPTPAPTREAALALEQEGRFAEAGDAYAAVLEGKTSELASVLWDLQTLSADQGRAADCIPLLRRLERLYAASPPPQVPRLARWDVVNSLAWYLATVRGAGPDAAADAERLAEEAMALAAADPAQLPQSLDTAAAAAARGGRFEEAVERIERAIAVAPDQTMRADFERRRNAYRERRTWDEP
ncbi:MAG: protein kinase domain-containing protein [Planctomycetaceae bacterium]